MTTTDKALDLLHAITEAAIAAGGVTVTLRFGEDGRLARHQADSEQLAGAVADLQARVAESDAFSRQGCTENARDIAGLRSQVADAEAGLACGHDCGGYSCPTLRVDWKRDGFSCPNIGCPTEQAAG